MMVGQGESPPLMASKFTRANLPQGFYTYAYLDDAGAPWYVGKGIGRRAWRTHGSAKHRWEPPAEDKILILKAGLDESAAFRHEAYLIAVLGNAHTEGGLLRANFTDGGEGVSGYRHTEEALARLSETSKGRRHSAEAKEKIAKAKRGKPRSEETKAKLSAAHTGKTLTAEHRQKIAQAGMGRKGSDRQRAAAALTNRTRVRTEEELQRRSFTRILQTAQKHGVCPAIYFAMPQKTRSKEVQRFLATLAAS